MHRRADRRFRPWRVVHGPGMEEAVKCAFCGEREASGFEDGRPVCSHCASLAADPVEMAWVQVDETMLLAVN